MTVDRFSARIAPVDETVALTGMYEILCAGGGSVTVHIYKFSGCVSSVAISCPRKRHTTIFSTTLYLCISADIRNTVSRNDDTVFLTQIPYCPPLLRSYDGPWTFLPHQLAQPSGHRGLRYVSSAWIASPRATPSGLLGERKEEGPIYDQCTLPM